MTELGLTYCETQIIERDKGCSCDEKLAWTWKFVHLCVIYILPLIVRVSCSCGQSNYYSFDDAGFFFKSQLLPRAEEF
jgi:hypothetical protein